MNFFKRIKNIFKSNNIQPYITALGRGVTMNLDAPMHIADKMPTEPAVPPSKHKCNCHCSGIYVTKLNGSPEKGGDLD